MKHQRHHQIASKLRAALAPMLANVRADGLITLRRISLNGNYSVAIVTYTVIGDKLSASDAQKHLDEFAPACRLRLARELNMRKTPKLVFRHDDEELAADKMRDFLESINTDADAD